MKGTALPPSPKSNRQDNALQGWPWVASTFSWVEPTAWCVLALKKWVRAHDDRATAARVAEGERLLIDRVCRNGGWNYGNSNVLGKELFPYVPVTAIVLLALQDRHDEQAVKTSASYLASHCLDERSGLSLALASIALAVHGRDNSSVASRAGRHMAYHTVLGQRGRHGAGTVRRGWERRAPCRLPIAVAGSPT